MFSHSLFINFPSFLLNEYNLVFNWKKKFYYGFQHGLYKEKMELPLTASQLSHETKNKLRIRYNKKIDAVTCLV